MANSTAKSCVYGIYKDVMEDVIDNVLDNFIEDGVDDQVLQQLKQTWDAKIIASNAVDTSVVGSDNPLAEECKKRWKFIRDSKCGAESSGGSSSWDLFERLMFLETIQTHTTVGSDININADTESTDALSSCSKTPTCFESELQNSPSGVEQALEDTSEASQTSVHLLTNKNSKTTRKSKKSRDEHLGILKKRERSRRTQRMTAGKSGEAKGAVFTFAEHVKSMLKKLSPRLQQRATNEVFNILSRYEVMQMDLQDNQTNTAEIRTSLSTSTLSSDAAHNSDCAEHHFQEDYN